MDEKRRKKLSARLEARWPFLGKTRRKGAIADLVADRGDPKTIPILVRAARHLDAEIRKAALQGLQQIAGFPSCVDALIEQALAAKKPNLLIGLIRDCGYRHSDEGRWFLFLALSGQFDEVLDVDFEFQTLRAEFRAASQDLQERIREKIVSSGDLRMRGLWPAAQSTLGVVSRRLGALTDADARSLVRVYARQNEWGALFRDLAVLPARRLAQAVAAMVEAGWSPEDPEDRVLFGKLRQVLPAQEEIPEPDRIVRIGNPAIAELLEEGKATPLDVALSDLVRMIGGVVPDPETQIRALGALYQRGALDLDILARACHGPHWIVRWTGAMLGGAKAETMGIDGEVWMERLSRVMSVEQFWGMKACQITRDGLDAIHEHMANLDDPRRAGGLPLIAAVAGHAMAHDMEIDTHAVVEIDSDAFEIDE